MAVKSRKHIHVLKYTVYGVLLLLFYVVQTTPRLFVIAGAKPLWVIPLAVAVAMHEGEFAGGIFGASAGLLCDTGGFSLFGFNGIVCCAACIMAGLLVIYLMQCNVANCVVFVFFTAMARGSVGYLFAYGIWSYDSGWKVFTMQTLPTVLYTAAIAVPLYYMIRAIHSKFQNALRP